MKKMYCLALIGILVIQSAPSFCPKAIITGKVTDQSGEPLIGASISVKGTSLSTFTSKTGEFSLEISNPSAILIVRYLGFKTAEIKLKDYKGPLRIVMEEDVLELGEVVVIETKSRDKARMASMTAPEAEDISHYAESSFKRSFNENAKAGVLTAGEINDFGKWVLWKDIADYDLSEWRDLWEIHPAKRFVAQLTTESGAAIVDAPVQLVSIDGKTIYWSARTDNTGKAELWLNIFNEAVNNEALKISILSGGKTYSIENPEQFHEGINILKIPVACEQPESLDISFVVDATGSMQDEIDYLKEEMNHIIGKIKDSLPDKNLRLSCVFYRDKDDEYLTRKSDFSHNIKSTVDFIKANNADGGGDYPEAVEEALRESIDRLTWSTTATARIIFLVLDAPPHSRPEVKSELKELIQKAAEKGIRIVPVSCSGIDKSTEYLLRSIALATNGQYVFLTDHSGIGGSHIEPTTDKYNAELLNSILFRIIFNFAYTGSCEMPLLFASTDTSMVLNPVYLPDQTDSLTDSTGINPYDENKDVPVEKSGFISWKYYPNPTTGIVRVEIAGELKELFVTDLSGKVLLRFEGRNSFVIELSGFPAGTYFLTGEYLPERRVSGKIVLVH